MIRQAASVALSLLFASGGAAAADTPPGKVVFDHNCAVCHAPGLGHPGTQRLAELRGPDRAVLEERTDDHELEVTGVVPPDLEGRLLRNGPNPVSIRISSCLIGL